jgi:phage shock protein PspC (stress-responsive transcriptional regulator)
VVAGVCAAFGRYTDTDPVLWRVSVAVLTLFGGAGLVLYALGWLLVPRRGEPQSALERAVRRQGRSITPAGVLLAVGAAVALLVVLDDGPGPVVLLVLGGVAWLVARERRDPTSAASAAVRRPTDDPLPAWSGCPTRPPPRTAPTCPGTSRRRPGDVAPGSAAPP